MKKTLILFFTVVLAGTSWAWIPAGSTKNPIIAGYYSSMYTNNLANISGNGINIKALKDTTYFTNTSNTADTVMLTSYAGVAPALIFSNGGTRGILYFSSGFSTASVLSTSANGAQNGCLQADAIAPFNTGVDLWIQGRSAKRGVVVAGTISNSTNGGGWGIDSTSVRPLAIAGSKITSDTAKITVGLFVGSGTMISKIMTGAGTFDEQATADTNLVAGATAASRVVVQLRGLTAVTAMHAAKTVADTLFVNIPAADTAAWRAGGYDYLLFK